MASSGDKMNTVGRPVRARSTPTRAHHRTETLPDGGKVPSEAYINLLG